MPRTAVIALSVLLVGLALGASKSAGEAAAARSPALLFMRSCAVCHGVTGEGLAGPALVGRALQHGEDAASLASVIALGLPERGMPGFGGQLSAAEIGDIVGYIRERRRQSGSQGAAEGAGVYADSFPSGVVHTEVADFTVEKVTTSGPAFDFLFLPDGRILISEAAGALRIVENGQLAPAPIAGAPRPGPGADLYRRRFFGLSLHPQYARNGWIYLLHESVELAGTPSEVAVTLSRGRLRNGRWRDNQDLLTFRTEQSSASRMAWDAAGFLYVGAADSALHWRGTAQAAPSQDLASSRGKILRMTDEGAAPADNPFTGDPKAYPYIWSFGHRVPLGLAFDRQGRLWESENGPRGGDEVNLIQRGRNYGWPVITWGHPYDSRPAAANTEAAGMEQPVASFVPSPALGDLTVYTGDAFPGWRDNLFVGSLKQGDLFRIAVDGAHERLRERILHAVGRIRALHTGPDDLLYILTDAGGLFRLRPAASTAPPPADRR